MLARREYSRAELTDRLVANGGDRSDVTRVLDELERRGHLSDARFAEALVARKAGRFGKRAIAHAMRERGVDAEAASDALASLDGRDELALATAQCARRFRTPPKDERERARQIRFLVGRGYSLSVAIAVVGRAAGGASARRSNGDADAE